MHVVLVVRAHHADEVVELGKLLAREAQARQVRLLTCACFYDWGPCDIFHPGQSCAPDTNRSRLCHFPLTVHKLRQLSWYDGWWRLLSEREPVALAALEKWELMQSERKRRRRASSTS